jgi:hypothetical protein
MGRTIPHHVDQNEIDREVDDFFAAGARLTKSLIRAVCLILSDTLSDKQAETRAGAVEIEKTPAPIPSDKRELTVKELAALWGVSTRSIYEWKLTHGLPYKKHGRLLRFDWIEANRWSERHRESFTRARLRVVK